MMLLVIVALADTWNLLMAGLSGRANCGLPIVANGEHSRTMATRPKRIIKEERCQTCRGTGVADIKQPRVPGHRIYPPKCARCGGKGRIIKNYSSVATSSGRW